MTVRELLERLNKYNETKTVKLWSGPEQGYIDFNWLQLYIGEDKQTTFVGLG